MANTLASLTIDQSRPNRHRALTQTNSRHDCGGKLYAHSRRFSLGLFPNRSQKREAETQTYQRDWYNDGDGWKPCWHSEVVPPATESPYGLVITPKSSQAPQTPIRERGDTQGITSVAKRRVSNMIVGMHSEYGRACIGFATCTLPLLPAAELATLNREYGRLNQVFFQRLKREAERCGVPWCYVAAYEIQEGRLDRWGHVALHTHFVFVSRAQPGDDYWLTKAKLTRFWGDALATVLGHDIPRKALTNVQGSKGKTGRELAKYQSKGSKVVKRVKAMGKGDELPGQWWSASKSAKEIDARSTFSLKGQRALHLLTYAEDLKESGALTYRPIVKELDGREVQLGIAGFFTSSEALADFMAITADDGATADDGPITVPRVGTTPDDMENAIAAALAVGDFDRVEELVEQADTLFPEPDKARHRMALEDSLQICDELDRRRKSQRLKVVYGYNEDEQETLHSPRLDNSTS